MILLSSSTNASIPEGSLIIVLDRIVGMRSKTVQNIYMSPGRSLFVEELGAAASPASSSAGNRDRELRSRIPSQAETASPTYVDNIWVLRGAPIARTSVLPLCAPSIRKVPGSGAEPPSATIRPIDQKRVADRRTSRQKAAAQKSPALPRARLLKPSFLFVLSLLQPGLSHLPIESSRSEIARCAGGGASTCKPPASARSGLSVELLEGGTAGACPGNTAFLSE
ncbi:hypothetical protein GGR52DRAFT_563559 [Hypoxylon sp. FL1284]|nr:hypothetical protein GGR52DRAFT_563559 [Hypoxylon sp. FL1284]